MNKNNTKTNNNYMKRKIHKEYIETNYDVTKKYFNFKLKNNKKIYKPNEIKKIEKEIDQIIYEIIYKLK